MPLVMPLSVPAIPYIYGDSKTPKSDYLYHNCHFCCRQFLRLEQPFPFSKPDDESIQDTSPESVLPVYHFRVHS
jgi:hypothetical protein